MLEVDEDSRLGRELLADGGRYHAASVPTDDAMADMYLAGIDYLQGQGIEQYEISNFAREGAESRHNLKYWRRAPTWGWAWMRTPCCWARDGHTIRLATSENLDDYLENPRDPADLHLSEVEQLEEEWFLGLRLTRGVNLTALGRNMAGTRLPHFGRSIDALMEEELLEKDGELCCG